MKNPVRLLRAAAIALAAAILLPGPEASGVPSLRQYTTADGLAADTVQRVLVDREGFVWIATSRGLSIFDGERFRNFTSGDGLPDGNVMDLAQAPDGAMWLATSSGLYRMESARFEFVPLDFPDAARGVHCVIVAPDGSVWAGTYRDLVHLRHAEGEQGNWQAERFELRHGDGTPMFPTGRIQTLSFDAAGSLWVGTHVLGIFRIAPDGSMDHISDDVPGAHFIRDFLFAADGRVWTTFFGGVARLGRDPSGKPGAADLVFGVQNGFPSYDTSALLQSTDGRILVGSTSGITSLVEGPRGTWSIGETMSRASGLPGDDVTRVAADAAGNLWIAIRNRGLARWATGGFVNHLEIDRPGYRVVTLFEDAAGRTSALMRSGRAGMIVWQLDREAFRPHTVSVPGELHYLGWLIGENIVQRQDGSWWIGTGQGILGWDDPPGEGGAALSRPPARWIRAGAQIPSDEIAFVHEDGRGDLWIGSQVAASTSSGLTRLARGSKRFETFPASLFSGAATPLRIEETPSGSLWILFFERRVFRYRENTFEEIASPLFESTKIESLEIDARGRLWLFGDGVLVIPDSDALRPTIELVPVPDRYRADSFACAVDDSEGNMWFGMERGVLRMDADLREWRLFTTADGLPGNSIELCSKDRSGRLWFSDYTGLARRDPGPDRPESAPRAKLREILVAGEPFPLPPLGATVAGPIVVQPGRVSISIEFFAVHAATDRPPSFEVRLGGESGVWEDTGAARSVHYPDLAPGPYHFEVRAVGADGRQPGIPAVVDIQVLAPVWRRGWFLALTASAIAGALYLVYRVRLGRAVEFERVRMRIATDLHDDIGSSLSQIAILGQLARRQVARGDERGAASLGRITQLAGEIVESMSDVVWAISPRGDRLDQLVSRMRWFGTELFADQSITLHLDLPSDGGTERLDADSRRQIYLIYKEALHNALRHSGANRVDVHLRREGASWSLCVRDDGVGLRDPAGDRGHGLESMRVRAARIGAALQIGPGREGGVEVVLRTLPRSRRRFPFN